VGTGAAKTSRDRIMVNKIEKGIFMLGDDKKDSKDGR
jgi:hypothetical protein